MLSEIFFIGLILVLGELFASLFKRTRLPDVLPLMLLGILLGPVFKIVTPASFGSTAGAFTTITLILVLFMTGMSLRLSMFKGVIVTGLALTLAAFAFTIAAVFMLVRYVFRIDIVYSLILGVITAYNSFVIIIPIIFNLNISHKTKTFLLIESTLGSVLAILLVITLINITNVGDASVSLVAFKLLYSLIFSAAVGFICGIFWTAILDKIRIARHSTTITFAFLLLVYSFCVMIGAKGEIGVLAFGVVVGNIRVLKTFWFKNIKTSAINQEEKSFFGEIEFILKTLFFVYMGICIHFSHTLFLLCGLLLAVVKLIVRLPAVELILPKSITKTDCAIAWVMCPSGLVGAVLATMAAQQLGNGAEIIKDVVYSLIFFSVIITSVMSFLIEKNYLHHTLDAFFAGHAETPDEPKVFVTHTE